MLERVKISFQILKEVESFNPFPNFMQTQFEALCSRNVLNIVANGAFYAIILHKDFAYFVLIFSKSSFDVCLKGFKPFEI